MSTTGQHDGSTPVSTETLMSTSIDTVSTWVVFDVDVGRTITETETTSYRTETMGNVPFVFTYYLRVSSSTITEGYQSETSTLSVDTLAWTSPWGTSTIYAVVTPNFTTSSLVPSTLSSSQVRKALKAFKRGGG